MKIEEAANLSLALGLEIHATPLILFVLQRLAIWPAQLHFNPVIQSPMSWTFVRSRIYLKFSVSITEAIWLPNR